MRRRYPARCPNRLVVLHHGEKIAGRPPRWRWRAEKPAGGGKPTTWWAMGGGRGVDGSPASTLRGLGTVAPMATCPPAGRRDLTPRVRGIPSPLPRRRIGAGQDDHSGATISGLLRSPPPGRGNPARGHAASPSGRAMRFRGALPCASPGKAASPSRASPCEQKEEKERERETLEPRPPTNPGGAARAPGESLERRALGPLPDPGRAAPAPCPPGPWVPATSSRCGHRPWRPAESCSAPGLLECDEAVPRALPPGIGAGEFFAIGGRYNRAGHYRAPGLAETRSKKDPGRAGLPPPPLLTWLRERPGVCSFGRGPAIPRPPLPQPSPRTRSTCSGGLPWDVITATCSSRPITEPWRPRCEAGRSRPVGS